MQIKKQIKQFVIRLGLWYPLDLLRRSREIIHWLRSGCIGVPPHPIKLMVVRSYLTKYSIDYFVETGTYLGDTLGYVAKRGVSCISVELSQELYDAACNRFKLYNNVRLVQGDSGQRLPELLGEISKPALFWLDGHYSGGITVGAGTYTPIGAEMQAILNHPIKEHVILIDDAHCFEGTNGYPHLDDILQLIREEGSYSAQVSTNIIRLVPRCVL